MLKSAHWYNQMEHNLSWFLCFVLLLPCFIVFIAPVHIHVVHMWWYSDLMLHITLSFVFAEY